MQTRSNSRSHIQIVATLTQRLKILRENNGYSQREVAEYLGKERSTYAYYELGKLSLIHIYHVRRRNPVYWY